MDKKKNAVRPLIQRLEALKLRRGGLAALARAVRVKPNVVTNWANGTNIPSWEYIDAIAKFLGLSVPEVFTPLEDGAKKSVVNTAVPSEVSTWRREEVPDGATTASLLQARPGALRLLTSTTRHALALGATDEQLQTAFGRAFPEWGEWRATGHPEPSLLDIFHAREKKRG
jgi:transcriptional regulator with XRE-family HTH domain